MLSFGYLPPNQPNHKRYVTPNIVFFRELIIYPEDWDTGDGQHVEKPFDFDKESQDLHPVAPGPQSNKVRMVSTCDLNFNA
jgi:hypothetical protein